MPTPKTSNASSAKAARRRRAAWIVSGVLVAGAALGGVIYARRPKSASNFDFDPAPLPPANPGLPAPAPRPTAPSDSAFPLRQGMRGARVRLLQGALNRQFTTGLATDGIWGPLTQRALDKHKVPTPISRTAWGRMLAFVGAADPYGATLNSIPIF